MARYPESAKISKGENRKMNRKVWYSLIAGIVLMLSLGSSALAQETTGSIVGTVKDTSGAVVPGATITISDPTKNNVVVRTVTASEDGAFSAPNLSAGNYTVTVEASSFKKSITTDVKVDVGQRRALDVSLAAGNIAETVTVAADPVAVELSTPTAGTTINGDQVRELSINNRNWVQLVALAPGVSNDLADQVYVGTTNPEGQANTINIAVNGARSSQNTFTVDGADVTDRGSNITIQAYPSVDSIGEFKVLRSLYPAESGRSGGGQINVVTRSGERRFHGSAYEFVRNEAFNANNFLLNSLTNPPFGRDSNGKAKRPPFHYNDFGWTFSGPIYFFNFGENNGGMFKKWDQTFFFFSEEFRRDRRFSAAGTVTVPDQLSRNGVFPVDVCINRNNIATETCAVGNPGRLAAGTPIPASFYSPAAVSYLNNVYNRLPLPNNPGVSPYALTTSLANVNNFQQEIIKIDHNFSDKVSAYYRYERDEIPSIDGNALFSSGTGLPNVATTSSNSPGRTHTFQTTYAASSNKIFEFRYNYGWGAILSENIGLLSLANFQAPITLPFANQRDRNTTLGTALTPANGFTSLTSFGPYDNFSYKSNWTGTFTWIAGNHTMKYGGVYSNYRKNENALAGNNEGQFTTFAGTLASGVANTATNVNLARWASFLVGNATAFNQGGFDYTADLRQRTMEAFAQDEWKARPNLTLYYGVRYSFFGAPFDKNGRLSNFDPDLWNPALAPQVTGNGNRISGVSGVSTGNWCNGIIVNSQNFQTGPANFNCTPTVSPYGKYVTHSPKTDFAPRVGLAWDPFGKGKTSIRTGYGIYHEQVLNGTYEQNIGTNAPYQQNANITGNLRFDNPAAGVFVSAASAGLRAVQADWKTPYMQHWSLDLQHQLGRNTLFTIGYFGSKGTNLIGITELNDIAPGVALKSQCAVGDAYYAQTPAPTLVACQPTGYVFRNTAAAPENPNGTNTDILILDQIRPFRGYRSIAIIQPKYHSTYHSMQVSAQHRLSGASQINLAYTWSKNLTDAQTDRSSAPQDTYNQKAEYGRAALDRRHVLTVNYVYELPFFTHQHDLVGNILGGWQASGIVTYQTGLPFTATTSNFDPAGAGLINANPAGRPNQTCDPNEGAPQTQAQFFNTNCFQRNPSNTENTRLTGWANVFGNAGRGTIQGPSTFRVDFTMAKNIRFGEHMRLQLRGEAYNIFNRTNMRSFSSTNVTSSLFGVVGAVRDPRTMQFAAKFSF
jgi:hypothetical protein